MVEIRESLKYQTTEIGRLPIDWLIVPIDKIVTLAQYGLSTASEKQGTTPIIGMKDLVDGKVRLENLARVQIDQNDVEKFYLQSGDILLNRTNSYDLVGKVSLYDSDQLAVFASYLVRFQFDKAQALPEFINYFLNFYPTQQRLKRLATRGVSQANINPTIFRKQFLIPLPPIAEQKKIAEILTTWDEAIGLVERTIEAKQKRNQFLTNHLLFGKKRSIHSQTSSFKKHKLFVIPEDWQVIELSKVFKERREFSSDITEYPLCSLTIEDGLIDKPERYNRDFLLRDKESNQYRIVYPGDFVYNPMNLRWGAIARSNFSQPVLISAYYNVLIPNTELIPPSFLLALLTSHQMLHIYNNVGIGTLVEKKRVHLKDFLKLEIPIPPFHEALKINGILSSFNQEIVCLTQQKELLQQQKRGLMQKLLTGKWRVSTQEAA